MFPDPSLPGWEPAEKTFPFCGLSTVGQFLCHSLAGLAKILAGLDSLMEEGRDFNIEFLGAFKM